MVRRAGMARIADISSIQLVMSAAVQRRHLRQQRMRSVFARQRSVYAKDIKIKNDECLWKWYLPF